jgi:two-component system, cell cycle response regulator
MQILIAEDDTTTRLMLSMTLQKLGHEVTAVSDGAAALDLLQQRHFPILISDWMMPVLDGPGLCRAIRSERRQQYTYILLLTSLDSRASYLEGMQAGADDFLSKPFDEDLLCARLRVAERILELHEALRIEATHDRLTGVLNRGAVLDHLSQSLERRQRDGSEVGVILIDVDHFKQVNDRYGHLIGDAVLHDVAKRIRGELRAHDRVGRYGGEEFVVVTQCSDPTQTSAIAERIRSAIASAPFDSPAGPLQVTASLGVANAGNDEFFADALVGAADEALYRAKGNGRNRVECAPARTANPHLTVANVNR